jgi:isoleucyl-tRNA synthetase
MIESEVAAMLRVRAQVNEAIEPLRAAHQLGKSLDAAVSLVLAAEDPVAQVLEKHRDFLPELFIVSHVTIGSTQGVGAEVSGRVTTMTDASAKAGAVLQVAIQPCSELNFVRCPRCWRWVPGLEHSSHGEVCPRCAEALKL